MICLTASVLELIGVGSRSTTPVSLNSRKSPTTDMGVQVNQKDGNRRNSRGNSQQNQQQERRDSGRLDGQGSQQVRFCSVQLHAIRCNAKCNSN